jgi:putative chitinase
MTKITDILKQVAPRAYPNYVQAFEEGDALLQNAGIDTPLRIAHLLAQVLHETGGATVLFENLNYTTVSRLLEVFGVGHHSAAIRPEEASGLLNNAEALAERVYGLGNPKKAQELGNRRPGDGYRYRGGGLLQTTGGTSYRRFGEKVGVDFYDDPNLIVAPEHALKPALEEWTEGNLNAAADKNDIRTITRVINGGYNGLTERQHWFDRIWPLVNDGTAVPEPWRAGNADDDTRWLQESLNDLGAQPMLVVDGRYGPATTAAVKWFQGIAGLKVDGIAGEVTRAAIRLRLQTRRGG